ncbi:MAG: hypothetical protein PCFJNLEI_02584 [Verrucomicrobiae bacterium]|nr:hypothetical protein [Verrucomicrobiae bacterium]
MKLDASYTLVAPESGPVRFALEALRRDWQAVFGAELRNGESSRQLRLMLVNLGREEAYRITVTDEIRIEGNDELGLVFGIYWFCEEVLGVDPYQFWTDHVPVRQREIAVAEGVRVQPEPAVRFRGWFINGEDCLIGWHDEMRISPATWRAIFETMLRAGFNMVIPGTGVAPTDPQVDLAAAMGLWITQHHAEPLGARMFSEAYPGIPARWPEEWPRFEALYREAILAAEGRKTVWAVGFRGQGDQPFYRDDPRHTSPEQRGAVIGEAIRRQQALIRELAPGPHHFAHNIYGESALYYRAGHLPLPDDVMRVWGDNGYGAMCMRRMSAHPGEKRIPATPLAGDRLNGVYYHVNFHDLQVSNQLTPLVAPELIRDELGAMLMPNGFHYLTLNVGNIRPHVHGIGLIGRMVNHPPAVPAYESDFCRRHFPGFETQAATFIRRYYAATGNYGPHRDERIGEEGWHYPLRTGIACVLRGENAAEHVTFRFIADRPADSAGCFQWMRERAGESLPRWETLARDTAAIEQAGWRDSFGMFINYNLHSCRGTVAGMEGLLAYLRAEWEAAFCRFADALQHMEAAHAALRATEHGKWKNFYRGDCLTGTPKTLRALDVILGVCRLRGDTSWPRSAWMIKALGTTSHAVGILGQTTTDDRRLAAALVRRGQGDPQEDLALLR